MDDPGYTPPPAFAPPALRVAPLNESAVLGATSYPPGQYAAYEQPAWPTPSQPSWEQADRTARNRSLTVLVSLGVAAALVAVATILLTSATRHDRRSLSLPQSVDEYTKVQELSGIQVQSLFKTGGSFGAQIPLDDLASAVVGLYSEPGHVDPTMLFVGFTAQDSPSIGSQLHTDPADSVTERVLTGAGTTTPTFVDAGPLGGSMRCARIDVDGVDGAVGVWADQDTLGIVLLLEPTTPTTGRTSTVTREFRAASEH